MGPEVAEVERKLAEYAGVKHCITVSSGTHSLEIALRAYNIGPGDEVVTVPFTWISTAEVIAAVGATPVYVDIDPITYNMDTRLLEKAITAKTKMIVPVSLFGQMADMTAINAIAEKYNIPVMEDAAQSFGASQNGKKSCAVSKVASTSFFPAKPLGCYGDGGALFTDDDHLADVMKAIRSHGGRVRDHHEFIGVNGRFDTIQAGVLLVKLGYFDDFVGKRERLGARYSELISGLSIEIAPPTIMNGNTHIYAQYTVRLPSNVDRDAVRKYLSERGIPTGVYYPKPMHMQPCFEYLGYKKGDFPESEKAANEVLSLPMHPYLKDEEQVFVVESLVRAVHLCRN